MKTFASSTKALKEFAIDDDVFRCAAELPAGAAQFLARMSKAAPEDRVIMLGDFLDQVMFPDDAERFAERLGQVDHPVTMETFGNIIEWLLEEYSGGRPTPPSNSSAVGSVNGNSGVNLTDGVLPAPSIPVASTSSAS